MKKYTVLLSIILIFTLICFSGYYNPVNSRVNGAPAGVTGSPSDGATCAQSNCHGGAVLNLPGVITSNIPVTGYVAGQTYTITATLTQSGISRFGFQISPQSQSGLLLGTLIVTSPTTTKIVSSKYITQVTGGSTSNTGSKSWSFNWIAPAAGTGDVTFYGAFNLANNNGSASGDLIRTSTFMVVENTSVGLADLMKDPLAFYIFPNPIEENFEMLFSVNQPQNVVISVYDLSGKQIAKLFDGWCNEKKCNFNFQFPKDVQPGIYLIEVKTKSKSMISKVMKIE